MSLDIDLAAEQLAHRAARLLARPGAVIEAVPLGYAVRLGPSRRRRPMLVINEAAFHVLARLGTLKPRTLGGWSLARPAGSAPPPAGRPGIIEGERVIEEPGVGRLAFKANLGESPLAWLARRRDKLGRPWLEPVEAAAGERLREEFHRAGSLGRLTMNWDGGPRVDGGRGLGLEPAERGRAAKDRIAAALAAAGPGLREILEQVCLAGTALEAAERALGLPRRAGKTVLKLALQRLVAHYRMG